MALRIKLEENYRQKFVKTRTQEKDLLNYDETYLNVMVTKTMSPN